MRLDHRPAVAIQRREKMRARLIEAAVLVVAGKGLENTVIDDIVAQAGVSRGTFYNHFAAVPDLMLAAQEELSNEILVDVEAAVRVIPKPDQRLAHGIFLFMATASAFPLLGHFVKALGNIGIAEASKIHALLPEHLAEGIASGDFCPVSVSVVSDFLASSVSATLLRECNGEDVDAPGIVAALLRGLGVERARAEELSKLRVAPLVLRPDSLVARSNAIWLSSR